MGSVMNYVMISNLCTTIVTLALLGAIVGRLLARRTKPGKRQQADEKPLSADTVKQLAQLKSQLDSGLITKEEYLEKREMLLAGNHS